MTIELRHNNAPSGTAYKDIHGTRVVFTFARLAPPVEVLIDRMGYFAVKNAVLALTRYCHFCLEFFKGEKSEEEFNTHVLQCRMINTDL